MGIVSDSDIINFVFGASGQVSKGMDDETSGHVRKVVNLPLWQLMPSPENDRVYGLVNREDPAFLGLVENVRENGILQPLTVTSDWFIVSGHRRFAAAEEADLETVPCYIDPICREDDIDAFVRLLVAHNDQREKTFSQKLHEEAVKIDPEESYARLVAERAKRSRVKVKAMTLGPRKSRSKIGPAKQQMLNAVLAILERIRKPTSDRKIHYELLNAPPLRNTGPTKRFRKRYCNDEASYKDLCDLLTRARLEEIIPWEWIEDETRPVTTWDVYRDPQVFISKQMRKFLTGYYRDLLQSQPNYIECLAEKNTVAAQIRDVCGTYCLPMTSGRGFCSSRPRWDLLQRYRKSGKDKLVLLIISDLDPSGMYIAQTFAESMRDDFGVEDVHAIKVAITGEQVTKHKIPHGEKVKDGDKQRGPAFRKLYGDYVYEVEALPDGELPKLLDAAIRSVLDLEAYNHEVELEAKDAAQIEATREAARSVLQDIDFGGLDNEE